MAKKKAPVALTGGRGFSFEDHVAARFLVDLLAGAAPLGLEAGTVVRLDWQTVERDGSLDDLVIAFQSADGAESRMPTSIKSHRQVTRRGFNRTFVQAAWEQWRGTGTNPFRRDRDLLGLVTGQVADNVRSAWEGLLSEALAVDPARLGARLRAPASRESGSTSSAVRRALIAPRRIA